VVVGKSGSAPQVPGAKGLFLRDGSIVGTIGGGCLEMEARRLGLEAMHTGKAVCKEFQLDDDFGWDDGLICGGRVQVLLSPNSENYLGALQRAVSQNASGCLAFQTSDGSAQFLTDGGEAFEKAVATRRHVFRDGIFYEPILPPERLVVFGGGHIGREIARIGSALGFAVTIVDDRPEFVTEERVPFALERVCMAPEAFARELQSDSDTYLCLVTRGHRGDAKALRELIHKERAFLGMIGSKRKREVVRKEFLRDGICTDEEFSLVRCPMGLDIGGESVEEIAVSIGAELVQVRATKRGPVLARCAKG
jgi:xanthine dehydrogenase accessory factor